MMPGFKVLNEYAGLLRARRVSRQSLYDAIPKAVLAAVAVSYAQCLHGGPWSEMPEHILREWQTLHENGVVPQKPPNERLS